LIGRAFQNLAGELAGWWPFGPASPKVGKTLLELRLVGPCGDPLLVTIAEFVASG
jgi:hypothetical protein